MLIQNLSQIEPHFINISYTNIEHIYDINSIKLTEKIKFKTGFMLGSEDYAFSEWSGMTITDNGTLFLVANSGVFLSSTPIFDQENNFIQLLNPFISPIFIGPEVIKREFSDVEEITYAKDIGCFLSHEPIFGTENYISFFKHCDFKNKNNGNLIKTPSAFKSLEKNKGIEALAISKNNTLVAIEEFGQDKIHHKIILWDFNNPFSDLKTLIYPTEYYVGVTAATFLPNNSLLVIERKSIALKSNECSKAFEITINLVDTAELDKLDNYIVNKNLVVALHNDGSNTRYFSENFEAITTTTNSDHTDIFILSDNGSLHEAVILQFELI
jgi:hypothetical protein